MSPDRPWLYIILGSAGSGRREVLTDLIQAGLSAEDKAAVILAESEPASPMDDGLPAISRWSLVDGVAKVELPAGVSHVFLVLDGADNPVEQIEPLSVWLRTAACELARVIYVADCARFEKHPELLAWSDACTHFSDVVLLNRREGVANKWMSEFRRRYTDLRYPCLFEMVKAGRVKNPALLLEPEARRTSHVFDLDEWAGISLEGVEIGTSDDEGEDGDGEPIAISDLDPDDMPEVDIYLERKPGGYRIKTIPDISRFLN